MADLKIKRKWKPTPEHRRAYSAIWRKNNRDKLRTYGRKYRHGITDAEYNALLIKQNGHCALCTRTPAQEQHGVLHIDHDHETKKIRGLLCYKHNIAIGTLGDNEAGLLKALQYLRGSNV